MDNLIRLGEWNVDEKRRQLSDLLKLMADLERRVRELDDEVEREKFAARSKPSESGMYYGSYIKAALKRRENLMDSLEQMDPVVTAARDELADAFQDLKKVEITQRNRDQREARERDRREQAFLDELGQESHRRRQRAG
ncbi:flagellar FliJ family protein [Varunaivibrio sulfuroxidans]|uniref:flagellar FliJ family protein n=1 Tax=Varunaivibrio sulfuroxidans TaxID=1773489 RepID=UPI001052AD6B|nr:flagellar FliJ family protein [Varunaivibrio sulfuroxidans]WES30380.1 flagellar FliJ family protein [Varunaivibrio sulfuroxidans]